MCTLGDLFAHEPRFVKFGGGEFLTFHMVGAQQAATTSTAIYTLKIVDYGQSFFETTRVTVATDATYG